jgi:hypothetical protein
MLRSGRKPKLLLQVGKLTGETAVRVDQFKFVIFNLQDGSQIFEWFHRDSTFTALYAFIDSEAGEPEAKEPEKTGHGYFLSFKLNTGSLIDIRDNDKRCIGEAFKSHYLICTQKSRSN